MRGSLHPLRWMVTGDSSRNSSREAAARYYKFANLSHFLHESDISLMRLSCCGANGSESWDEWPADVTLLTLRKQILRRVL